MKLCHIIRSGPVFSDTVYNGVRRKMVCLFFVSFSNQHTTVHTTFKGVCLLALLRMDTRACSANFNAHCIFIARRVCRRNMSVCPSVRLSVCHKPVLCVNG